MTTPQPTASSLPLVRPARAQVPTLGPSKGHWAGVPTSPGPTGELSSRPPALAALQERTENEIGLKANIYKQRKKNVAKDSKNFQPLLALVQKEKRFCPALFSPQPHSRG